MPKFHCGRTGLILSFCNSTVVIISEIALSLFTAVLPMGLNRTCSLRRQTTSIKEGVQKNDYLSSCVLGLGRYTDTSMYQDTWPDDMRIDTCCVISIF